jgi:small GTP-binding protein
VIRKKILLLGDFGVGKTSLIRRYIDNSFSDTYLSTIGVKISKKILTISDIECELIIWDIEGATTIKSIPNSYYKGASGAIFVADVNRSETIDSINGHVNTFLMLNKGAAHVVAYNKSDLLNRQQKELLSLPKNSFLVSAKDNENVSVLFQTLAKEIIL